MQTAGLSLDQAPPLDIPARFFLTAPLMIIVAGVVALVTGSGPWASPWYLQTMGWVHLGTLGVIGFIMMGALYQMVPVVAGAPVPLIKLAKLVHAFLLLGLIGMQFGFYDSSIMGMKLGVHALMTAMLLFVLPVGYGLIVAPMKDPTVWGMRLAFVGFLATAVLGFLLARGHYAGTFPAARTLLLQVHFNLALLTWVGGLIVAVSWQVVPMFYLTPTPSKGRKTAMLVAIAISLVALMASLWIADATSRTVLIAAAPAALVVWVLHPISTLRMLSLRKRPRPDGSLLFWRAGLTVGLALVPLGLIAHFSDQARWSMLWGWWAIWGWGGLIVHGMLTRIVPFLVWFHRMSPLVGLQPVPSMRGLLAQKNIKLGLWLHLASLLCGSVGMLSPSDWLSASTGGLLIATGAVLLHSLIHVLRQFPPSAANSTLPAGNSISPAANPTPSAS
ncbi:MAG: hypothetical protein HQ519_11020 [Planctomycetes bacterium]|nr:hypothetical protein [Planctomycetota bacterium]